MMKFDTEIFLPGRLKLKAADFQIASKNAADLSPTEKAKRILDVQRNAALLLAEFERRNAPTQH